MNRYEILKGIEFNAKAEAQAIFDYTDFLKDLDESDLFPDEKNSINAVIEEIISDELNHQERLMELFTALSEIPIAKT